MLITSLDNDRIKGYIKLKDRKYRKKTNTFIVEGLHSVIEAYKCNLIVELILEKDEGLPFDAPHVFVTKEIINKISSLESPSSVMALCKMKEEKENLGNKILILENIQDPGNLGTIIRSAKAFNVDTIVLSPDTVDIYNPKVVRSTQGIMFHINFIVKDISQVVDMLKEKKIPVYGTNVENGRNVCTIKDKDKFALIMGNEGTGLSKEIASMCDDFLYIDMNKKVESLNVAVATSILLYEMNKND